MSDLYVKNLERDDLIVEATVVDVKHITNYDTADDYLVIVQHTFEGEQYNVNLGDLGKSWQSKIGQTVRIQIDPNDPTQTLVKARNEASGMVITGLYLVAAMIAIYAGIRGMEIPENVTSKTALRLLGNLKRYIAGWVGLLIFGVGLLVYCCVFGFQFGNDPPILAVVSIAGAVCFVVLPREAVGRTRR